MEEAAKRLDALERVLADMIVKQGLINQQFTILMAEMKRIDKQLRSMSVQVQYKN
ncbi:hypothetical protein BpJC7_07600 [Weizmannia acidilactici]|uniref:Uncharacterized protein n=1 Tax=Weizmannia acidilactici TaxID=2607726 RepID=A0A5J4JG39_9BACI|nr:hypothetical protein [Weizmannia acidilactici]GER66397.1 hypothetical protein BpJC4_08680 [Weizmannia acidilactici]GER69457.1 hypothetical protein BpJC7_07600 [Weizmannia acidilactici]GER72994.1 hypothetical protein BpPP18_10610 [Weizmannia acidilactici]